jgi:hypothetical protein
MKIFDFLKRKKGLSEGVELQQAEPSKDLFSCHYCQHQFEVTPKMIFPTSVRILYKDQFTQGKGVLCPNCKKTCIFG